MLQGTLIYGLINSVILALVAMGFSLTFGISGVANFAYGAFYVLSGFLAWVMLSMGVPYTLTFFLTIVITAVLGAIVYQVVLIRVRGNVIAEVIATFGTGLAILELFHLFGFLGTQYTLPNLIEGSTMIFSTYVDKQRIIIVLAGIVLAGLLWFFIHHTRIGLAFRGISQEKYTSLCIGISADRMSALSMAMGGGLAAVASLIIFPLGSITSGEGYDVLINVMAVCIIGGLGSTIGMIVGSFLLGYAQTITANYIDPHYTMIVMMGAILLVLIFKPSGLFGHQKELEERV